MIDPRDIAEPDLRALRLDDAEGPAPPISRAAEDRLVDAVLRAGVIAPIPAAPIAITRAPRRRRTTVLILLAAALTLAAASALAGWWSRSSRSNTPAPSATAPEALAPGALGDLPDAAQSAVGSASVEPPPVEAPPPAASEAPTSAPIASAPRPARGAASPSPPAVDLLKQANQLRAQKRWVEAERAYRLVASRFPGTPEAYTATIAAASIRLDQLGDPGAARDLYRKAEASGSGGELAEEIDYGIAESYRASGDRVAEARSLRAFLQKHPESLLRAKAEARLRQLNAAAAADAGAR